MVGRGITFEQWREVNYSTNGIRYVICTLRQLHLHPQLKPKMVTLGLYHLLKTDGSYIQAVVLRQRSQRRSANSCRTKKSRCSSKRKSPHSRKKKLSKSEQITLSSPIVHETMEEAKARFARPTTVVKKNPTRFQHRNFEEISHRFTKECRIRLGNTSHIDKDSFIHPAEGIPISLL